MKKQMTRFRFRALVALILAAAVLANSSAPGWISPAHAASGLSEIHAAGVSSRVDDSFLSPDDKVTAFAQDLFWQMTEGGSWDTFQYLDHENLTFMNFIDTVYDGDYKKDTFFKRIVEWATGNTSGDGFFFAANPESEWNETEMYISLLQAVVQSEDSTLRDVSEQAKAEAQKTPGPLSKGWTLLKNIFSFAKEMNSKGKDTKADYEPFLTFAVKFLAEQQDGEKALRILRMFQTIFSRERQFQQVSSSLSFFNALLSESDDENLTQALKALTTVYSKWGKELEKAGTEDFVPGDESAEEQFAEKKNTRIRNLLHDYLTVHSMLDPEKDVLNVIQLIGELALPSLYLSASMTTSAGDLLFNTDSFFQAFHTIRCMYNIASAMAETTKSRLPASGADWRDYVAYAEDYLLYLKLCAMGNAYLYGMMSQESIIGWDDATEVLITVIAAIRKTFALPGLAAKAVAAGLETANQLSQKEERDQALEANYEKWYRLQMQLLDIAYNNTQSYIARIMLHYYDVISDTQDMAVLAGREDLHERVIRGTLTEDEFYADRADPQKPSLEKPNEYRGRAASGVSVRLVGKATGKEYASAITDLNGEYELHYMHEAVMDDPLELVIAEECKNVSFAPKHVDIWRDASLSFRSGWKSALADAAGYDETTLSYLFEYCDQLFLQPSSVFSQQLARLSLGMALAGYSAVEADPEWETTGAVGREANIADAYSRLGFTGAEYYNYDAELNNDDGKVAFSLAFRDIVNPEISVLTDPEQKEHLLVAVLRGGGYGSEWVNNFLVGGDGNVDADLHYGFGSAAMKVKAKIEEYRASHFDDGRPVRLWITGYSRSAAVSNLVAGALSGSGLFDSVYAYLFATPSGTQAPQPCPGIFNIVYEGDLIPRVALTSWGYGKNGETLYFGSGVSPAEDAEFDRIAAEFQRITRYSGAKYDPRDFHASSYVMDSLMELIGRYVKDESDYVSKLQPYVLALTRLYFTRSVSPAKDASPSAEMVRQDIPKGNRLLEERISQTIPDYRSEIASLKNSLLTHGLKAGIRATLETMNQDLLYYTLRLLEPSDLLSLLDVVEWFLNDGSTEEEKAAAKEEFYEYCLAAVNVITAGQMGNITSATEALRRRAEYNQFRLAVADKIDRAVSSVPFIGRTVLSAVVPAATLAEKTRELGEAVIPILGMAVLLLAELGESTLFETNTTVSAIATGHTPETYLSWLMALDAEKMFSLEDRMRFSLPLMPVETQIHGDVSLTNPDSVPYSGLLPQPVQFFGSKAEDRLCLQYDESGTDLLIAVPGSVAREADPDVSSQQITEWKEKYPHIPIEHLWELKDGYYNYRESLRLGYTDVYIDSRRVMWTEGLDGKLYVAVFDHPLSYMAPGLEPTGYWFYILPQTGTEMKPIHVRIPLTTPPGTYTGKMAEDHTTVDTSSVSRMNVEYDEKSGLWCFAVYQWGYYRTNPNDQGGRMLGGYPGDSVDEWRLARNLFTVAGGKMIPVARFFLDEEFERNGIRTDGTLSPGWFYENGRLSYRLENGEKAVGWLKEAGSWYYFDTEGAMQTGWISDGGKRFWLDETGALATGWIQDGADWYYLDDSGSHSSGWKQINNVWYYFQENGRMVAENRIIDGKMQLFDSSGAWQGEQKLAGWIQDGDVWYYYDQNGNPSSGWKQIDDTWYYFHADGKMATGWITLDENGQETRYYLTESGAMAVGTQIIDGKTEFFSDSGAWQYSISGNE